MLTSHSARLHRLRTPLLLVTVVVFVLTSFRLAAATGEQFRGDLFGWGPGIAMASSLGGTYIAVSGKITDASTPTTRFKFFKATNQWFSTNGAVRFGQPANNYSTSNSNNSTFAHFPNSYYAAKWNGNDKGVIFQLKGAPVAIRGVNRSTPSPNSNDAVTVTLTTVSTPPTEQTFFLRYTTNNFSASSVVQMTGAGTSRSATIPPQSAGANVSYYVLSSTNTTSIAPVDADLMTINLRQQRRQQL